MRRKLIRFSLRTLLCFVLLVASLAALWRNCDAWQAVNVPKDPDFPQYDNSRDGRYIELSDGRTDVQLRDGTGTVQLHFSVRQSVSTANISPDGKRLVVCTYGLNSPSQIWYVSTIDIWDLETPQRLFGMAFRDVEYTDARLSKDGQFMVAYYKDHAKYWHRRRPEEWWGLAWMPEFWISALLAGAFGSSVWQDRRAA